MKTYYNILWSCYILSVLLTERYLTDIEVSISDTNSALNFPSSVCSSRSGEAILSPDAHVCTLSAVTPVRYVRVQSKAEISVNLCITEIQVFSTISNNTLTTWGRSTTMAPPNWHSVNDVHSIILFRLWYYFYTGCQICSSIVFI